MVIYRKTAKTEISNKWKEQKEEYSTDHDVNLIVGCSDTVSKISTLH